MAEYKVTTAKGEQYKIAVNKDTVRKLLKDQVIVKYEKVKK